MNEELDLDHCFQTVTAVAKEAGVVSNRAKIISAVKIHGK